MAFYILLVIRLILGVPCKFFRFCIEEKCIVCSSTSAGVAMSTCSFPNNLSLKHIFAKNLVEHHFNVVRGVPVTMIIKTAGFLEDAVQLDAAGTHKVDISLCGGVAVFEGAFFLCLAPEDLIIAVGVKRRVDIDKVNASIGEFFQLIDVIAAINDAGVN